MGDKLDDLTDEQLQLLVSQQEQRRIDQCSAEINVVLEKYGCMLVPIMTIINGQVRHVVRLDLIRDR